LERAIELAPDYENAYYFAAIIEYELGAFEEVARYCEAYLERVPFADEARLMLGDAQFELGHFAEALAVYDRVIANGSFAEEDIENYAFAKARAAATESAGTQTEQQNNYMLGDESVPSIESVVGSREMSSNFSFGFDSSGSYLAVNYLSASVFADLQAYIEALIDSGWSATEMSGNDTDGVIQLATDSSQEGKVLAMTAEYTTGAYSIKVQITDGTLRRFTDNNGNKWGEILRAGAASVTVTPAEPGDVVGSWRLNSVMMMGMAMDPSELGMEMTMELNADYTALLHSSVDGDIKGTWAIKDGQVIISADDGTDGVFVLKDGNLCDDQSGMVFGKE
jgi:hypothetical protein